MKKEDLICKAILEKRILAFYYEGHYRTVEPHAYGVSKDNRQIIGYQLTGKSNSNEPLGWRQFSLKKMAALNITNDVFKNDRLKETPKSWERKIAVVC